MCRYPREVDECKDSPSSYDPPSAQPKQFVSRSSQAEVEACKEKRKSKDFHRFPEKRPKSDRSIHSPATRRTTDQAVSPWTASGKGICQREWIVKEDTQKGMPTRPAERESFFFRYQRRRDGEDSLLRPLDVMVVSGQIKETHIQPSIQFFLSSISWGVTLLCVSLVRYWTSYQQLLPSSLGERKGMSKPPLCMTRDSLQLEKRPPVSFQECDFSLILHACLDGWDIKEKKEVRPGGDLPSCSGAHAIWICFSSDDLLGKRARLDHGIFTCVFRSSFSPFYPCSVGVCYRLFSLLSPLFSSSRNPLLLCAGLSRAD